jgi:hypothetical protein
MAPDPAAAGQHFSEIMGALSLARPGCGNTDICFQIQESIRLGADRVIIGTTDSARTELKMSSDSFQELSLKNFRNGDYISDTIPTLIGEEPDIKDKYSIHPARRAAVKQYLVEMYDSVLKHTTDMWALGYWYQQLQNRKIQYDVLPKNFCIYTYALQHPSESYTFHTNFATQHEAAILLLQQ